MTSSRHLLLVSALTVGVAVAVPGIAAAQQPNPNCPPGSWFCEEQKPPANPPATGPLQPLPPDQAPPQQRPQQPPVVYQQPAPPVVVYQPPPPVMVVRPESPPPYYAYGRARPVVYRRPVSEWGLNLHIEGAMIGSGRASTAGMGGAGFGLRYKPIPHFGVEADLDFATGTDYNGFHRNEQAFTMNALVFLNPRSRAQLYLLAGFGWSGAQIADDTGGPNRDFRYAYFGGQIGIGLELRLSQHFALNADLRGFIRGRIDDQAQVSPEFFDPSTGQSTNTSAGGLLTAGATFYF